MESVRRTLVEQRVPGARIHHAVVGRDKRLASA
jgi:hypothetical protein